MVFCNRLSIRRISTYNIVTILILIDGFLQSEFSLFDGNLKDCHNPYFNRWFSAM